jgi:murein L,D-transpeptidase YafK
MKNALIFSSLLLSLGLATERHSSPATTEAATRAFRASGGPEGTISIIIDKSDYELSVYDEKGWYATFPVVFGNNSLADKRMEGDKNTPEGIFRIQFKKIHDKWSRFMGIDYPNEESWEKFKKRKARGEIPSNAKIGGAIGIHGTWPNDDMVVDRFKNWTLGCISMKNQHVQEIYNYTPVGTKVVIRK